MCVFIEVIVIIKKVITINYIKNIVDNMLITFVNNLGLQSFSSSVYL